MKTIIEWVKARQTVEETPDDWEAWFDGVAAVDAVADVALADRRCDNCYAYRIGEGLDGEKGGQCRLGPTVLYTLPGVQVGGTFPSVMPADWCTKWEGSQ